MSKNLLFCVLFGAFCAIAAAAPPAPAHVPQVPRVKKREIPCQFQERAGVSREAFFKVILPLEKGELFALNNLQMVDEKSRDIPLHIRVGTRWQDGSFQWLLLQGRITLPKNGKRTLRIQYGSQVLGPLSRQVIQVESGNMWQFSTGKLELQLPKNPAALPQNLRLKDKLIGSFVWGASPPPEFAKCTVAVLPQGNVTTISYRDSKGNTLLQCRIYRDSARINFSGSVVPLSALKFKPANGSVKFAGDDAGAFDFTPVAKEVLLAERNFPVYGTIPVDILRKGANIPAISPEAEKFPGLKSYKELWYKNLRAGYGSVQDNYAAYFNTGDISFLLRAEKMRQRVSTCISGETYYAFITGMRETPAAPAPAAHLMPETAARTLLVQKNEREIKKYLAALTAVRSSAPELFLDGVKRLIYALDRTELRWFSLCDPYGSGYGPLLDSRCNITGAELLLAAANMSGDRQLFITGSTLLKRGMLDGNYYDLLCNAPGVFKELTAWHSKHPADLFRWERDRFMQECFARKPATFYLGFFGKRNWHITPRAGVKNFLLPVTRTKNLDAAGLCHIHIYTASGKELRTISLPKTNLSLPLYLPADAAKAVIEDDDSGSWDLTAADAAVALEADNRWLTLRNAALKKFTFTLPQKSPPLTLRFSNLRSDTFVELIAPGGKRYRPVDQKIEIANPRKGKYQLRIHSGNIVQFAFDRVKILLQAQ